MPTQPAIHVVKFERNRFNGLWRAVCSCGWFDVGQPERVQQAAAGHDLEWVSVEPEPVKASA